MERPDDAVNYLFLCFVFKAVIYMEYTYRFRIYPNKAQENLIQKTFGCCRFVYNHYLAERKTRYETAKEAMNYNACSADLTKLKCDPSYV